MEEREGYTRIRKINLVLRENLEWYRNRGCGWKRERKVNIRIRKINLVLRENLKWYRNWGCGWKREEGVHLDQENQPCLKREFGMDRQRRVWKKKKMVYLDLREK